MQSYDDLFFICIYLILNTLVFRTAVGPAAHVAMFAVHGAELFQI